MVALGTCIYQYSLASVSLNDDGFLGTDVEINEGFSEVICCYNRIIVSKRLYYLKNYHNANTSSKNDMSKSTHVTH
jgi:hypothetical protein